MEEEGRDREADSGMREGCGEDGWVEQLIRFRESRRGKTKRNGIGGETVMEGGG